MTRQVSHFPGELGQLLGHYQADACTDCTFKLCMYYNTYFDQCVVCSYLRTSNYMKLNDARKGTSNVCDTSQLTFPKLTDESTYSHIICSCESLEVWDAETFFAFCSLVLNLLKISQILFCRQIKRNPNPFSLATFPAICVLSPEEPIATSLPK